MATTALVAEILIVGLEGEVVLGLIVLALFGDEWIRLDALEDWTTLVTVLVLASAYVVGIIVDRLADTAADAFGRTGLGAWVNKRVGKSSRAVELDPREPKMRLRVLAAGGNLAAFLEYQRSRLRVARGTMLTSLLALPSAAAFLARSAADLWDAVVVLGLLAALFLGSVVAAERIGAAYINRLVDAYKLVRKREGAHS